jgi:hypothetical protein
MLPSIAVTLSTPLPKLVVPITRSPSFTSDTLFVPVLLRLTAPVKTLAVSVSMIVFAPALMLEVPVTSSPPLACVIAPPAEPAIRLRPMLPVPRFRVPADPSAFAVTVRSLVRSSVPSARPFLSITWASRPLRWTVDWKSLADTSSEMSPAPASIVVTPVAVILPPPCPITPLLALRLSVPAAEVASTS